MSLLRSLRMSFPEWERDDSLPEGLSHIEVSSSAELRSYTWSGDHIRRARLCELDVPGKFTAETLVIYPNERTMTPIFGTEYITISDKKYFGAIDFHPLSQDQDYIEKYVDEYLYDFPTRNVEDSKFYDLSKYFSERFWIRKSPDDFSHEYYDWVDRYLARYRDALVSGTDGESNLHLHADYDTHMGENDPAHGILKAYFSQEFADFYVNKFLFDLSK